MRRWALCRTGLAFLAANLLGAQLDALALVRLRRAQRTDGDRGQPEQLAVDRLQGQVEGGQALFGARDLADFGGHALGEVEHDRVAEAEREVHLLALHLSAEADAANRQLLLPALGDAVGGVAEDRPG